MKGTDYMVSLDMIPDGFSARARFACETALKAAEILMRYYDSRSLSVSDKGERDLVTEADYASEKAIRDALSLHYPEDAFIGEESGYDGEKTQYIWVTDPLDGTVNYAHGIQDFSISLGCLKNGQPYIGAVVVPVAGVMFCAEKGRGAYKNGQPIHVAHPSCLKETLLATDFSLRPYADGDEHLALYTALLPKVMNIIKPESSVMTTAYAASGRFGATLHQCLCIWDIAASVAILQEAGAIVTDRFGKELVFNRELPYSMIAACPEIHSQLLEISKAIPQKNPESAQW